MINMILKSNYLVLIKNMHLYKLFEIDIENNFNLDGELSINTIINYKYDNLKTFQK